MKKTYKHYYIVKQKGKDKYLSENVSRYGTSLSLTTAGIEFAIHFENVSQAETIIRKYVQQQKTLNILDFELEDLYIEYTESPATEKLFNNLQLSLWSLGMTAEGVNEESLKNALYRVCRLKVKNVKWEIENNSVVHITSYEEYYKY